MINNPVLSRRHRTIFFLFTLMIFVLLVANYNKSTLLISINQSIQLGNNSYVKKIYGEYPSISNGFLAHKLKLDRPKSDDDLTREAQEALPNFPISFWAANKGANLYYKKRSCARFPVADKLHINNVYWQMFRLQERFFYLFNAYYDVRRQFSIRILGYTDTNREKDVRKTESHCQIWFKDYGETCIVKAEYQTIYRTWSQKSDGYQFPYLITCPVPKEHSQRIPMFVSLVHNKCDVATNNFRVILNRPTGAYQKKGRFAVCVKMMDFYQSDESARIIEWVELLGILGAEKIHLYPLNVHKNLSKVFEYYKQKGKLEVTPYTLPGDQINEPASFQHIALRENWRPHNLFEQISINDCFYRHMYEYEYITVIDIDEVITPRKAYNWTDLLKTESEKASRNKNTPAYYVAQNVLFNSVCQDHPKTYEDIPPFMKTLQNVVSHTAGVAPYPKVFFNTDLVTVVHNHGAQICFTKSCSRYEFSVDDAVLQHFREEEYPASRVSCDKIKPSMKTDTNMWKYKKPLIDRTLAVLNELGFLVDK